MPAIRFNDSLTAATTKLVMKRKLWNHISYFVLCILNATTIQAVHAEPQEFDKIGSFHLTIPGTEEQKPVPERLRLITMQAEPDQVITFAWHDKVSFNNPVHYISLDEMLKELQQKHKKNFLHIHLEKRFEWNDQGKRTLFEKNVIEFAKKTGFRRCLITIDTAFGNIVLANILDGLSESDEKKKNDSKKDNEN